MPKKTSKKTGKKTRTPGRPGRPKGAKNITTEELAVISKSNYSRKDEIPGYKRVVIATNNSENAKALEKLATMIEKKDRRLLSVITPPKKKKAKKPATTKA